MKKNISILGCGWFGVALAKKLIENGYNVKGSTTTPEKIPLLAAAKIRPFLINFTGEGIVGNDDFFDADVLFICIPPKRNSAELESYPFKIKSILESAENRSANIVLISSTSVYGDENKTVNENTSTRPDTASGGVVADAEEVFKIKYPQNYTIIRFAGLIGPERNPGRFFAGKTNVPNGLAPVNLIHQTDAVGIAISILDKQAFGRIYNACAPTHPPKQEFYTKAALDSGLQSPEFVAEKASWKIVESINVPAFLGYAFEIEL